MPTHFSGSEAEVLALNAFINFMRASDALADCLRRGLGRKRLTLSQFGTLEVLFHLGPLNQGELASKLLRSCGSITAVVAGLERRGLARRERIGEDKRFVRVALTGKGRKLISELFPAHAKTITKRFEALTSNEQKELRRICRMRTAWETSRG